MTLAVFSSSGWRQILHTEVSVFTYPCIIQDKWLNHLCGCISSSRLLGNHSRWLFQVSELPNQSRGIVPISQPDGQALLGVQQRRIRVCGVLCPSKPNEADTSASLSSSKAFLLRSYKCSLLESHWMGTWSVESWAWFSECWRRRNRACNLDKCSGCSGEEARNFPGCF